MNFMVYWWLKRRAKEHRQTAVLFFALAAALTAIAFTVVIQRSVRTPSTFYANPNVPDFSRIIPSPDGSLDRSYWRVSSLSDPSFIVGYRGERGAEVALISWNRDRAIYEPVSVVKLDYGAEGELPRFQPVEMDNEEVFLARLSQDNGWQAVYLIGVKNDGLTLAVESIREDGTGQPFAVGSSSGACRSMRIGDVDGDGLKSEILVTAIKGGGKAIETAYRWRDGRLFVDEALTGIVRRSSELFPDPSESCSSEQGIYIDEIDGGTFDDMIFVPAEPATNSGRQPLFEEIEVE